MKLDEVMRKLYELLGGMFLLACVCVATSLWLQRYSKRKRTGHRENQKSQADLRKFDGKFPPD
jgi:hypothetical protein